MSGTIDRGALCAGRVLITGASGGIGQALARGFRARGAELVLSGRRREVLHALARQLDAQVIVADLAVRDDVERLAREAGAVDVLVANAGLSGSGTLIDLDPEQIERVLAVNLHAPIALSRAMVPGMLTRGRGHVVTVSSVAGKVASPHAALYNATKFGLRGFTLGLRQDLHAGPVSASVVSPGFISDAGMFHDSGVRLPPGVATRSPDQVADAVLRAIGEDRAEITVAPLALKAGAGLDALAPAVSAALQRRLGAARIAEQIAAGQRRG